MVGHEYFKSAGLKTVLAMANIKRLLTTLTNHYRHFHAEMCIILHMVVEMPSLSERTK